MVEDFFYNFQKLNFVTTNYILFRIQLEFNTFELEAGTSCNFDYVEIREVTGQLVGR